MKIFFICSSRSREYESWKENLEGLGHQVKGFFYNERLSLPSVPLFLQAQVYRLNRKLREGMIEYKPDLLICSVGKYILPSTIKDLKSKLDFYSIYFAPDDPQLFERISKHVSKPFDYVFTCSKFCVPKYEELGKNVEYFSFFCDPKLHRKIELSKGEKRKYKHDIVFVGNYYPVREEILKWLTDYDLMIYGPNWKFASEKVKKKWTHKGIYGEEMVKLYNAAKIVLNIHVKYAGMGANVRMFEATGCGAFHLTDNPPRIGGMRDLFNLGKEVETYRSKKELLEKIDYYLENDKEREKIAGNGYQRTHKEHTIKNFFKGFISKVPRKYQ